MKQLFYGALFFFSLSATAQNKVKVTEANENAGNGAHNALVVTIYDASTDEIQKEWKSLMKDYKAKVSGGDALFADNAIIPVVNGNNTIDVYSKAIKVKDGETKFVVCFDLGGAYLNSSEHGVQFKEAKQMIYDFAVKMNKEALSAQLKEAQKVLNKQTDQKEDLEKDSENRKKDIESYKEKIKKNEEAIEKNKSDVEVKKKEMEQQSKVVAELESKIKGL